MPLIDMKRADVPEKITNTIYSRKLAIDCLKDLLLNIFLPCIIIFITEDSIVLPHID
jgi:hypothetical protein